MSAKQGIPSTGAWVVSRKVRMPGLTQEGEAKALVNILTALPGVHHAVADVGKASLAIRYDASRIDYATLATTLADNGYPPAGGWWANLKANWYQFTDSNARENANLPEPPCCNKSPK